MEESRRRINMAVLTIEALQSDKDCFSWLQGKNLVPKTPYCPVCGKLMELKVRGKNSFQWRCRTTRKENPHRIENNALKNTFFGNSSFGIRNIISFMYFFSNNITNYNFLLRETVATTGTIADWLALTRQICFLWLDGNFEKDIKLGGPGIVVEFSKCKIGKKKVTNNKSGIENTWILVMSETPPNGANNKGRYRIDVCPENAEDPEIAISFILKYLEPETTILTDLWAQHFGLKGFYQYTIDHTDYSIEPVSKKNIQKVESFWDIFKSKTGNKDNIMEKLAEYLYRREVKFSGEDPFEHFIKAVNFVYPGEDTEME